MVAAVFADIAAVFSAVMDPLPVVAPILAVVAGILPVVATVFQAVALTTVVASVPAVLPAIKAVFADIAAVFPDVAPIFPSVPRLLATVAPPARRLLLILQALVMLLGALTPLRSMLRKVFRGPGGLLALLQTLLAALHELLVALRMLRLQFLQPSLQLRPAIRHELVKSLRVALPERFQTLLARLAHLLAKSLIGFGVGFFQVGQPLAQMGLALLDRLAERLRVFLFEPAQPLGLFNHRSGDGTGRGLLHHVHRIGRPSRCRRAFSVQGLTPNRPLWRLDRPVVWARPALAHRL
jgi:hypothetical protein